VRTGRTGAAAKAGHDLRIVVTAWRATLVAGEQASLELVADPTSLRVEEGTGGLQALGDDDKANIHQTIDDEVLERREIAFRSTGIVADGDALHAQGELTLHGATHPIAFAIVVDGGGALTGTAVVRQTDWGMKPYSALFGALKVADEVTVAVEATLASPE
jgi:hypothetical protein